MIVYAVNDSIVFFSDAKLRRPKYEWLISFTD